MKYYIVCILVSFIAVIGCGEVEEDARPAGYIETVQIPEDWHETSTSFYKPDDDQIQKLLNLRYPHNWYDEPNLELQATYYYAMMLQRYGDTPAVHIHSQAYRLWILSEGKPYEISSEDNILSLKAMYILWPNPSNLSALNKTIKRTEESDILENTDDPDIYRKILTRRFIEQHGDIPSVYVVVEGEVKLRFGGFPVTTDAEKDQYISYLRASYVLQPTEYNLCILNAHIDAKANGIPFHKIVHDCKEGTLEELFEELGLDME